MSFIEPPVIDKSDADTTPALVTLNLLLGPSAIPSVPRYKPLFASVRLCFVSFIEPAYIAMPDLSQRPISEFKELYIIRTPFLYAPFADPPSASDPPLMRSASIVPVVTKSATISPFIFIATLRVDHASPVFALSIYPRPFCAHFHLFVDNSIVFALQMLIAIMLALFESYSNTTYPPCVSSRSMARAFLLAAFRMLDSDGISSTALAVPASWLVRVLPVCTCPDSVIVFLSMFWMSRLICVTYSL